MARRIQLMAPDEEFDRIESHFFDGLRSRVIRNLLIRACEAIEDPNSNITSDAIIRGDFKIEDHFHGNF